MQHSSLCAVNATGHLGPCSCRPTERRYIELIDEGRVARDLLREVLAWQDSEDEPTEEQYARWLAATKAVVGD